MGERRSQHWYAGADRNGYIHRSWMRRGLPDDAFDGRPHIAIADTGSDLVPCNRHLGDLAGSVANGIWEAGGVPLHMPVMGLGETQVRPTAMLWRNLAAMSAEELFRANPIDGVVLLGGCDKTIPSLLMAAASVDLPALVVPGGPMLTGTFQGEAIGCGTSVWRQSEEVRAGTLDAATFIASESAHGPECRPLQHDGDGLDDGVHGRGARHDHPGHGRDPRPGQPAQGAGPGERSTRSWGWSRRSDGRVEVMTAGSFRNAIVTLAAVGGSTNAVVHLLAIAAGWASRSPSTTSTGSGRACRSS